MISTIHRQSTAAFAVLVLALAAPGQQPLDYGLGGVHTVGNGPSSAVAGDLDNDGDADLVVANGFDNTITVFTNHGGFPLTKGNPMATAIGPSRVVLADFDGDGFRDVAALCVTSEQVSILLNDGAGNLLPQNAYPAGIDPFDLRPLDVDGDGDVDLLVTNHILNRMSLVLNLGGGTFGVAGNTFVGGFPTAIELGDLDRDGDQDIVVASAGFGAVVVFENTPAGFNPINFYVTGFFPYGMALGDVNNDGRLDIITANIGSNDVSILPNMGNLVFGPPQSVFVGLVPTDVVVTNTDNAIGLDLAVTRFNGNAVAVYKNSGVGTFGPRTRYFTGVHPVAVVSADFDGDFADDLVSVDATSDDIVLLRNLLPAMRYPGTGEDLDFGTGVNAPATAGPGAYIKTASVGDTIEMAVSSPLGTFTGLAGGLGVQPYYPGFPPSTLIPGLYLNNFHFGVLIVPINALPPTGMTVQFVLPPASSGFHFLSQAGISTGIAQNGFAAFTDAYEVRVAR